MFFDLRDLENNTQIDSDLCIVGAGAAGIALAREFSNTGVRVCLVESGGLGAEEATQELTSGANIGTPYYPLDLTRFRQFGGSTARWGGACAPLNELDFEHRPWVPHSGWPITRRDLDPYYARAQALFEIGPFDYRTEAWAGNGIQFLDFAPERLVTRLWQNSPETHFGVAYRDELRRAENVKVLLHANATEILTDDRAAVAEGVRVVSLEAKSGTVRARYLILACGGIENARLLLLSDRVEPAGLGNANDLVGRFFMEHPHIAVARVQYDGSRRWLRSYKDFRKNGVSLRAGLCLSEAAQRSAQVLNYSGILVDRFVRDTAGLKEASGYLSLKSLVLAMRRRRLPRDLPVHLRNIVTDLDSIAVGVYRHLLSQNPGIYTRSEQAPNPDSRVILGPDRDRLGQRKVQLDWRLMPLDKRTIRVSVQLIGQEFERLGIGRVTPDDWLSADDVFWAGTLRGGYHHMGTTRMSDDPKTGVVDADGRVHGLANLYVAGSSVFPTAGYANPTLTIAALSLRLADHLKERLGRREGQQSTRAPQRRMEAT